LLALANVFLSIRASAKEGLPADEAFPDTLKRLFGSRAMTATAQIPQIAENGAVVPLTVSTGLENITAITILVEKNPSPFSARFELSPELEPTVSARLKMAETCCRRSRRALQR
jgi:sulfur-oxidizing protein SoxY